MIQMMIARLYKRQVIKTYNENKTFVCNFVLEYRDEFDNLHKVSCFMYNQEPIAIENNRYLVELEIYATQNVTYKSDRVWLTQSRVLKMEPLMNELEEIGAKEIIKKHYKR